MTNKELLNKINKIDNERVTQAGHIESFYKDRLIRKNALIKLAKDCEIVELKEWEQKQWAEILEASKNI